MKKTKKEYDFDGIAIIVFATIIFAMCMIALSI